MRVVGVSSTTYSVHWFPPCKKSSEARTPAEVLCRRFLVGRCMGAASGDLAFVVLQYPTVEPTLQTQSPRDPRPCGLLPGVRLFSMECLIIRELLLK